MNCQHQDENLRDETCEVDNLFISLFQHNIEPRTKSIWEKGKFTFKCV